MAISSFEDVYKKFYKRVKYSFLSRGFSAPEAEDLTQETFLKAFKHWDDYREDAGPGSWLDVVGRSVMANHLRARSTRKRDGNETSLEEKIEIDGGPPRDQSAKSPEQETIDGEALGMLEKEIGALPPRTRCVVLLYFKRYKYREIADMLNISIETVKSHMKIARQKLEEKLGQYFKDFDF